jgi:hypothetical protein
VLDVPVPTNEEVPVALFPTGIPGAPPLPINDEHPLAVLFLPLPTNE